MIHYGRAQDVMDDRHVALFEDYYADAKRAFSNVDALRERSC